LARWLRSARSSVEDLLLRLGAPAEQIERERVRAHDELFKGTFKT